MSEPNAYAPNAAPGWYPDGRGGQRCWPGAGWSEHTAPAPAATSTNPSFAAPRTPLPEGARVDNIWVWIVALSYLVSSVPLFFFDMNGYMRAIFEAEVTGSTQALSEALAGYLMFFALAWLLSLALWGLLIFSAFRDYRHLQAIGVVRPFHWAFAFIPYTLVYLIGRHVVLRKVSRTAGWPLWAHIASYALVFIVAMVWSIAMVQEMVADFPRYLST